MRRFGIALLYGIAGYIAAAFISHFLVQWFSSNVHDRSVEAAMTSVFFFGPMGGVLAFISGLFMHRTRPSPGT